MNETFLRLPTVVACTGLPKSVIYSLMSQGRFPKPIPLCPPHGRSKAWIESEVAQWIDTRISEARP
jgi:prophage regulatory protein